MRAEGCDLGGVHNVLLLDLGSGDRVFTFYLFGRLHIYGF